MLVCVTVQVSATYIWEPWGYDGSFMAIPEVLHGRSAD